VACHRFGAEGGGIGPDLTNLAKRSDYKSMLESILDPSLVVSEQFEQHELKLKNGSTEMGRIVGDENGEYSLVQSGFEPMKVKKVSKADVVSKAGSKISMMPPALINSMNAEELKDLIAYFVSQGDGRHAVYKKPKSNKKLNIELVAAVYGVEGDAKKQMDVRQVIQQRLAARDYDFEMSNAVAGRDPAPGVVKTLQLQYTPAGQLMEKTVRENGIVPFNQ
jgi:putative heme-binding domain-containing protein